MAGRLFIPVGFSHLACKLFRNVSHKNGKLIIQRYASVITGNAQLDKSLNVITGGRTADWLQRYENFVGLTDVKHAQSKVIEAESVFVSAQCCRRDGQQRLSAVHARLQTLAGELERVPRGADRYLALVRDEVAAVRDGERLATELTAAESAEHGAFGALSSAVRASHERERARAERTKYWSVAGSLIGAAIGIIGTSINNHVRMRELRSLVGASVAGGAELKDLVTRLAQSADAQHEHVSGFLSDVKTALSGGGGSAPRHQAASWSGERLEAQSTEILRRVREQSTSLAREMDDLKVGLAAVGTRAEDGQVVYLGPQLVGALDANEQRLEWRMKMNTLYTVTLVYAAFALSLPVLYAIFSHS